MSAVLAGYIYPVRLDWARIVTDLKAAGCSRYRIAMILGVGQSTVERWEEGSEPRHAIGQALLTLHEQLLPDATQQRCMAKPTGM